MTRRVRSSFGVGEAVGAQRPAVAARDVDALGDLVERHVLRRGVAGERRARGRSVRASCTREPAVDARADPDVLAVGREADVVREVVGRERAQRAAAAADARRRRARAARALEPSDVTTRVPSGEIEM